MPWIQLKLNTTGANAEDLSDALMEAGAVSITFQDTHDTPVFEPLPGETRLWGDTDVIGLFDAETDMKEVVAILENHPLLGAGFAHKIEQLEDKDMTRIIYHGKQYIAKLTLGSSLIACLQSLLQLAQLLLYLSPYGCAVLPVKADLGSLALQLIGTQQRRQSLRYAVQYMLALLFFLLFDSLPIYQHIIAVVDMCVTENMRMPADKLIYNLVDNVLQIKAACLLCHAGMENNLHEQVAKLLTHAVNIVSIHSLQIFVNLFNHIAADRFVCLLSVPMGSRQAHAGCA